MKSKTKSKENKEKVKKKPTIKQIQEKQLYWTLGIIALIFIAFIGTYLFIQSTKTFDFAGTEWQIEEYADVTMYHTQFNKIYKNQSYGVHNTFLRNDPRKNNIPTNISLEFYKDMIISQDPELLNCRNAMLSSIAIGQATLALPFITGLEGSTTDPQYAQNLKINYSTCKDTLNEKTVVIIQKTNETQITQDKTYPDCYIINVATCNELLPAVERFIIEINKQINQQ